jgi:Flp pilus assembly pilin Flp
MRMDLLRKFHTDESGQDLIEYVLVVAAVAVGAVAGSGTLSNALTNAINGLNGRVTNCITTTGTTC